MKPFLAFATAAIITFLTACNKNTHSISADELSISQSTICGWCTGGDSLTVTKSNSYYSYYTTCDQGKATKATSKTDAEDWKALIALLDLEKFKKIDLNVCNVCADGCDVRVTIKQNNYNHSISYGGLNNPEIAEIKPFLEKLMAIQREQKKQLIK